LSKDVVVLTDDNWKTEVGEASEPVLVDFWAEWCAPCRMIGPAVEALAATYKGRVKVGKLDVDDNPGVAQAFGIRSIPTLLVLRGGKVVEQQVGAVPQSQIAAMLDSQLEPVAAGARRA
jgi:thioredoxin 1